ncbi:MAG TPA: threonine synthase [Bacteroidales bacterium]|nr:threonine synthase [Bacteroidales bacterium]
MLHNIRYYSTNLRAEKVSFREALLKGLAPDRGLYMPDIIPVISREELQAFKNFEYHEIAYEVIHRFLYQEIPDSELLSITRNAYDYQVPLENVYERKYMMRLDHGPTASFKDFAARLMGRLMQYFLRKENRKLLILTATSGDTGSAIANAFYELDNIKAVVLFPETEVTARQRKQMTTLHKNIQIISVKGKFDDCQAMVKKAFADPELSYLQLSSANSINIGRLLPQSVYYIFAYCRLNDGNPDDTVIFSVPSGNFGDLIGGLIAMKTGLPVRRFVVSTNENDEVPVYWQTGNYKTIIPSINCISSAMNVGHPSNMSRIIALYGGIMNEDGVIIREPDIEKMRAEMFAVSIDDKETKTTIKTAYEKFNLLLEPHGAVGWAGLMKDFEVNHADARSDQLSVSLETAHPAKFPEEIRGILGIEPELPESLRYLDEKEERYDSIENDYQIFKNYLKDNY